MVPPRRDAGKRAKAAVPSPEREAFLAVLRTADDLASGLAELLRGHALSPPLYNVLRILRGAGGEGIRCGEIAGRMVTRDPDVTRLLDRLEKRGLARRARDAGDRRAVRVFATDAGLRLLGKLDGPVADLHVAQLGHVGAARLRDLVRLLEAARSKP